MKRIFSIFMIALMAFSGTSCSSNVDDLTGKTSGKTSTKTKSIETLKSWTFQYNEGTNDYSLFFALLDKNDKYISAEVDADIRIVDEKDNELYKNTVTVKEDDFGYYSSQVRGEKYLANIKIPAANVKAGASSSGTVYLTVYKDNLIRFAEVNCHASYCLPVKDVQVAGKNLPIEITVKDYKGGTTSKIRIDNVSYTFETDYMLKSKIVVSGEKTYGVTKSTQDMIAYKIYDSEGYVVNTGFFYLSSLSNGDKFKIDLIGFYDVVPGESYTIEFSEYKLY